jgi:transcriptional regulator with XRE-family HTH domain
MAPTSLFEPEAFATFGELLQFLRRRVRKNLRELAQAVGYSEAHLSRIERGERLPPERAILATWFVPSLELEHEPELVARLFELAEAARLRSLSTKPIQVSIPSEQSAAVGAGALPGTPLALEPPEGTMPVDSRFYVERPADMVGMATIQRSGVTVTIKGPRQVGKSSLLVRLQHRAEQAGKRVAYLDFQQIDQVDIAAADRFFRRFCAWLSDVLAIESQVDEYWQLPLGNIQRCSRYVERHLLGQLDRPLALAMDEVDSLFESDFRSDFFGMLRSWHNDRSMKPIWRRLDLVLVTSTEPNQLIENLNQSPFNVGETLELPDFTLSQVADLNGRHAEPLSAEETERLWTLCGGHPFLTRRALYVVASRYLTVADLFDTATAEDGPFAEHLRHHLVRLQARPELAPGMLHIIRTGRCPDGQVLARLQSAGLVKCDGGQARPYCQLYAEYFRERLSG